MQIKKKRTAHPTFHRNVREEIQLEANSPKRWGETLLGPSAGCLFKFYGPYLSRLTIAFSGLWGQKYSILGKGWIVRPAVSRNKDKFVDPMPWREGVVAGGWVYGMPRGWGGDTFTISRDSLSDREKRRGEERDPALRGSRNDERARRRFANRKTATRYIGEFTYSLSRSFLPPYIYIYIYTSFFFPVRVRVLPFSKRGFFLSAASENWEKKREVIYFLFDHSCYR